MPKKYDETSDLDKLFSFDEEEELSQTRNHDPQFSGRRGEARHKPGRYHMKDKSGHAFNIPSMDVVDALPQAHRSEEQQAGGANEEGCEYL